MPPQGSTKRPAMRRGYLLLAVFVIAGGLYLTLRDPAALWSNLSFATRTLAAGALAPDHTATAGDVNVVVFVIDTLRADRVNTYGYERHVTTPNIDALATQGVVFEQAYTAAPWTLPSLASVMTARFPCEHGLLATRQRLPSDATTLPKLLKAQRFTTIGLYANTMVSPCFGFGEGYDFYQESLTNEARQVGPARRMYPGRPFYLYVHNLEPHNPWQFAPAHTPGFRDVSDEVRDRMGRHYREYRGATWRNYEAGPDARVLDVADTQDQHVQALAGMLEDYSELYDAAVREADRRLGSVIQLLKDRDEWDRTLFVVLSDHGEELNEHGGWSHDQSVYEEMVRVPLVIRFPEDQYAGRRVTEVVSLVDVVPTILDVLGRSHVAADLSGESLVPFITGAARRPGGTFRVPSMRHNVMSTYARWQRQRGDVNIVVRRDNWKGIWNVERDALELYDLSSDPGEQTNVAAEHPDLAVTLRRHTEQWRDACQERAAAALRAEESEVDEETMRKLHSLGYVD